jgi:hypothetical protein
MSTGTITPPVASVTSLSTGEAQEEKHSCSLPRKHKRPKTLTFFFFYFASSSSPTLIEHQGISASLTPHATF